MAPHYKGIAQKFDRTWSALMTPIVVTLIEDSFIKDSFINESNSGPSKRSAGLVEVAAGGAHGHFPVLDGVGDQGGGAVGALQDSADYEAGGVAEDVTA